MLSTRFSCWLCHAAYIKETKPGENIEIIRDKFSEKKYTLEGKHLSNNAVTFRGIIEF